MQSKKEPSFRATLKFNPLSDAVRSAKQSFYRPQLMSYKSFVKSAKGEIELKLANS